MEIDYEGQYETREKGNNWFTVVETDWTTCVGPVYGREAAELLRRGLIDATKASDAALALALDGLIGATPPLGS